VLKRKKTKTQKKKSPGPRKQNSSSSHQLPALPRAKRSSSRAGSVTVLESRQRRDAPSAQRSLREAQTQPSVLIPQHLFFQIASLTISVESASPDLQIKLQEPKDRFLVNDVPADVKIQARWEDLREEPRGREIFSSGSTWKLFDWEGSYLFRLTAPVYGTIPYKEAIFNSDFSAGEIRVHRPFYRSEEFHDPLEYPLDELLIIHLLSQGRGAEVHALGIADSQGNGYLFPGQSGAGKSTMARLWQDQPGIEILSDDRIILCPQGNKFLMYGTPWHGDARHSSPRSAILKAIFFLGRGKENELIPLKRAEALGRFFACGFPLFYDRPAVDALLAFFEKIVATLPCHEIRFFPDGRVVDFLLRQDF
jgi:hypothetical protein